jgi:hypothetical protein
MPTFNIANVKVQGADIVMIILDSSFERKSPRDQEEIIKEFQVRTTAAGFRGDVIPIWDGGKGTIHFRAPVNLHPFLSTITPYYVAENFKKQLSW